MKNLLIPPHLFHVHCNVISGGSQLTVSGDSFGDSGATVTIGDENCDVISQTSVEIICNLPGHEPGTYDVEVTVGNLGYADIRSVNTSRMHMLI